MCTHVGFLIQYYYYSIHVHDIVYMHTGVRSQYRRQGIGRHLMNQLFSHVAGLSSCLLVYLHVLATNSQALGQSQAMGYYKQGGLTLLAPDKSCCHIHENFRQ